MCVLTNSKDRLVYVTWHKEDHDLMVAKCAVSNFQDYKDLLLRTLKGVQNSTFKAAADKHGFETADQFDSWMFTLAKLFFSEECINHQNECLRSARKLSDNAMQEFVSSMLNLQGKTCYMKVHPEQKVSVWKDSENVRIAHNIRP